MMEIDIADEFTEPLKNGDLLPKHPSSTTALKIVRYGDVWDDQDGTKLTAGLHENEVRTLMNGDQMALRHLYRYAIRNDKIFHTRSLVVIDCDCEPA